MKQLFTVFVGLFISLSVWSNGGELMDPPATVESVDLERYQGLWYEITRKPNNFQTKCLSDVTAQYRLLENGQVEVINRCFETDGTESIANGRARVEDPDTNAKLKVTFANFFDKWWFAFGGEYWIIGLEENYNWVVIGHPKRDFGWILARKPKLRRSELRKAARILFEKSYKLCDFNMTQQNGGYIGNERLCEILD